MPNYEHEKAKEKEREIMEDVDEALKNNSDALSIFRPCMLFETQEVLHRSSIDRFGDKLKII